MQKLISTRKRLLFYGWKLAHLSVLYQAIIFSNEQVTKASRVYTSLKER